MSESVSADNISIGLAISRDRNKRLLTESFGKENVVEITGSVPDNIDICLADVNAIRSDSERFANWRERNAPVFSPVVIITEGDSAGVRAEIDTDSRLQLDSVIEIPVSKAQLHDRVDNLVQRQKLSRDLNNEKQLTESVFDSSPLAKLVFAPDGTIERANRRASELFDVDDSELIGQSYTSDGRIELPDGRTHIVENGLRLNEVLEIGDPISDHECVVHPPQDNDIVASVNVVPLSQDADGIEHVLVTLEDVTTRRNQAKELERQIDLFTKAEDIANVGAWEYNPQTEDLHWTDEVYRIFDIPADVEIDAELAINAYHPADRSKIEDALEEAIETGKSYDLELRVPDKNDEIRWVRTRGEPQHSDNETVLVRGTVQDITKRKHRQRQLERIETLFDNAQDSLFLIDTEDGFSIDQVNSAWEEATGYSAEAVRGMAPAELLGEQQASKVMDKYRTCAETREPIKYEEQLEFDDTTIWWETQIAPVIINDRVAYIAGSTRDITDRKERREKLQQMTNAVDNAPVGIVVSDPTQKDNPLIYVNDGFVEQTGYSREEATGQNCRFLQGERTNESTVATLRQAIEAEEQVSVTIRNYRADGTEYWNQLEVAPITDSTGEVINYIGFQQDVTEQREQKKKLDETKQRLELVLSATDTGVWTFNTADETFIPVQMSEGVGFDTTQESFRSYLEQIHPTDREAVRDAIKSAIESEDEFNIEFKLNNTEQERWLRSHGTVVTDNDGIPRVVGVTTEVTEQVRRKKALEKRERILRELHSATREFYPPESKQHVAETLVQFLETAVGFECISMKLFDDQEGVLQPEIRTPIYEKLFDSIDTISPGSNPIWEAYRTGESDMVDATQLGVEFEDSTQHINYVFISPIGNFGVLVVGIQDDGQFDEVDLDLVEVVTANAEAMFQGLETANAKTQLSNQLSTQSSHIGELQTVVNTIQAIQERVSQAETHQEMDEMVCEALTESNRIDFAWVGRPRATDNTLRPTASAGGGMNYVDTVRSDSDESSLPANIAATELEEYTSGNISNNVQDTEWAKEALSSGYQSVVSVPLVYQGVLYGTITAYSEKKQAFDDMYGNLLTDAGSLLLSYTQILNQRSVGSNSESTIWKFEFDDTAYPPQQLAVNSESEIHVKTVTQATDESATVLAEVSAEELSAVQEVATNMTTIESVTSFGTDKSNQLLIEVNRPFLTTEIEKHGGKFVTSVSNAEHTHIWIEMSNQTSQRPLFEFIDSRFDETELLARKEQSFEPESDTGTLETLTERQLEILFAAYYGGYYETPREVTGEDLAESFDISSPAVYNHLQAAHSKILTKLIKNNRHDVEAVLDS